MPFLGDYIGHIISEITRARLHADLEALRVADYYAKEPLLRHFPVPRFRLPSVKLEVPVAPVSTQERELGDGAVLIFDLHLQLIVRQHLRAKLENLREDSGGKPVIDVIIVEVKPGFVTRS